MYDPALIHPFQLPPQCGAMFPPGHIGHFLGFDCENPQRARMNGIAMLNLLKENPGANSAEIHESIDRQKSLKLENLKYCAPAAVVSALGGSAGLVGLLNPNIGCARGH